MYNRSCEGDLTIYIWSLKWASCCKSVASFFCPAVIKPILWHVYNCMLALDKNKSAVLSCQQRAFSSLNACWLTKLFIHKLHAHYSNHLQQVCEYQFTSSLIFIDMIQVDDKLPMLTTTQACSSWLACLRHIINSLRCAGFPNLVWVDYDIA